MDVESASAAFVLIAVTLLIAFVAAAEVALASTARSRVSQWIELSIDRAQILDSLLTDPARFLSTLMLLKNAAYVAGGAAVMWLSFLLAWTWPRRSGPYCEGRPASHCENAAYLMNVMQTRDLPREGNGR